ncbi:hypothetical protein ACWEQL_21650 [Kitasatospora sp. NPDC004240]
MTAATRIARLRHSNPAAAELATLCSLAVRVEPALLRNLRLLLPHADAAAEADLWFSDLVTARDATAIALDPAVADTLRQDLSAPTRARLLADARRLISSAHHNAHWSVRLEEQVHYLDTTRPPGAREEIEQLLLAGLEELNRQRDPGVARWLLGAVARLPTNLADTLLPRVAVVAAGAHLDGRADRVTESLTAAESAVWLPWLLQSLPTTLLPVQLLNGAVVLGAPGENSFLLDDIPDTDPLILEVRWEDGEQAHSHRVALRPGEPVQVETGTDDVTLVTLAGRAFRLGRTERASRFDPGGLRYEALKATLRPCLGREDELARLRTALADNSMDRGWIVVPGPQDVGKSVLLVAAADELRSHGVAVIEHFYGTGPPEHDDPDVVAASLIAQLVAEYRAFRADTILFTSAAENKARRARPEPDSVVVLEQLLRTLADHKTFLERPLVILIDGRDAVGHNNILEQPPVPLPDWPPDGVRYAVGVRADQPVLDHRRPGQQQRRQRRWQVVNHDRQSDRAVCHAMLDRDRAGLIAAFGGAVPNEALLDEADSVPGRLSRLLHWLLQQPAGTAALDAIPPSLTTRWDDALNTLAGRSGHWTQGDSHPLRFWLFLLVAADGRNTWADCANLMPDPPEGVGTWEQFRLACTANRLVCPSGVDDLVHLSDPSVAVRLRELDGAADFLIALHRRLAQLESSGPHGDSATLRAAAVHHALEASDLPRAVDLCLDLRYLRLRYAEDPAALITDLTAVTTATDDPRVEGMRQAVHALAKNRVVPAHFADRLHDRLRKEIADGDWLDKVFQEPLARPPLRVTRVLDHDALRGATLPRREPGPVLACSMLPDDSTLLLEREAVRFLEEPGFTRVPPSPLKGAVAGPAGSFTAWSEREVVVIRTLRPGLSQPVIIELGRPPKVVDFAACFASATVLATPEGTVRHYDGDPYSKTRSERLLVGHGARITAAADGEMLLTASQDGTIRLWDTGRNRARVFTGHRGAVRCATYFPDGRKFVSGGDDGMVLQWSADQRTPALSWAGHVGPVLAVTVLADERVVSASADNTLRVWPPTEDGPVVLTGHEDAVTGCLETAGGILSWSADGTVRLWSPRGGPAWHVARGFPGGIRSMTAVGYRYTVLCGDGSVEARILPTRPSDVHVGLGCLAVRGEDVLAGVEAQIAVVNRDGTPGASHRVGMRPQGLSTTPGEEPALLIGDEGELWTLDGEGRTSPFAAEPPDGSYVGLGTLGLAATQYRYEATLAVRYPGMAAATGAWHLQVASMDLSFLNAILLPASVTALASGGPVPGLRDRIVVAGTETGNVHLVDGATGEEWRTLVSGAKGAITAVAVADGGNIVIGAGDGNLRVVPVEAPGTSDVRHAHDGPVSVLATAGARVVSGGQDGRLMLWDVAESEPVHTVVLEGAVTAVAAADTWLAARDASGKLWLLDLDPAAPLTDSSPFSQPGTASVDITDVAVEGNTPDQELVVRCRLSAAVDLELRAVLLSVGTTELPTSMSLDAKAAPDPIWAAVEPDGALRLPLWLSAGEDLDLWMRTPWRSADLPPVDDLTVTLRLASPYRAWRLEVLRVQGTARV